MNDNIRKINNWLYRHGWRIDNRVYQQYIWKEQTTSFVNYFEGKGYRLVNSTVILLSPFKKTIGLSNRAVWRSEDGDEKEYHDTYNSGYNFGLTPDEYGKIKELYDELESSLQKARQSKNETD